MLRCGQYISVEVVAASGLAKDYIGLDGNRS